MIPLFQREGDGSAALAMGFEHAEDHFYRRRALPGPAQRLSILLDCLNEITGGDNVVVNLGDEFGAALGFADP